MNRDGKALYFALGLGFTFLIAAGGYLLAFIPGLKIIGPLACAIILAILYRHWMGYPEKLARGIQFSSKHLLKAAIILYGLKLNLNTILHQGLGILLLDAGTIIFSVVCLLLLSRWFKADRNLSFLLAVGTGICGASAIAAISSITHPKEEDTAISVGLISVIGTLFAITYTLIRPFLPFNSELYGIWSGISLHEVGNVALAGAPSGDNGMTYALLAKLGRVLLLVPFSFGLIFWINRKNKEKQNDATTPFPWFLIGFIIMSLIGTYVFNHWFPVSKNILHSVSFLTTFLLTMAMAGLGLNVNLKQIGKAVKPLIVLLITSIFLSGLTYLATFLY